MVPVCALACPHPCHQPAVQGQIHYPFPEVLDLVLNVSRVALQEKGRWVSSYQGLKGVPKSLQQERRETNRQMLQSRYGWVLTPPKHSGEFGWTDPQTETYMFYDVPSLMSGTYRNLKVSGVRGLRGLRGLRLPVSCIVFLLLTVCVEYVNAASCAL